MNRKLYFTLTLVLCAASVHSQESHPFSNQVITIDGTDFLPYTQGEIKTKYYLTSSYDINNPTIENAYKNHFKRIDKIILQWPTIRPPQGIGVFFGNYVSLNPQTSQHASKTAHNGRTEISFSCYILDFEEKKFPCRETGAYVDIFQNCTDELSGTPLLEDILLCPRKVGDFHGMPVYQTTRNEVTVISKKGISLFVPVSREEYLKACIRQAEGHLRKENEYRDQAGSPREFMEKTYRELLKIDPKSAAEFRKEMEQALPELEAEPESISKIALVSLRTELNNMSQTERESQAYYNINAMEIYNNFSCLMPADNKDNPETVVRINPLLIDYSRPNDLQLMTISWGVGRNKDKPRLYNQGSKGYNLADNQMFQLYNDANIWKQLFQLVVK